MEQYLWVLALELQTWVKEHNPESAAKAAELADVFAAARRRGQPWSYNQWNTFKDPKRPSMTQEVSLWVIMVVLVGN